MGITAKSIILDIADNQGDISWLGIRSLELKLSSVVQNPDAANISATYGPQYSADYSVQNIFDGSKSKVGTTENTAWYSTINTITNVRIICVFTVPVSFDEIVINNAHHGGIYTNRGAQNVKITISTDTITDTTYDASIANSTVLYNSTFDEHTGADEADDQILTLTILFTELPSAEILMAANFRIDAIVSLMPAEISMIGIFGVVETVSLIPAALSFNAEIPGALFIVPVPPANIAFNADINSYSQFTTGEAILRYYLTITGAVDSLSDIDIPMASFQARRRSGSPTYLSAVIPTIEYIDSIAARSNGTIRIDQGYEQNGVVLQRETIIETDIERADTYLGSVNQSIVLTGYTTSTFSAKTLDLTGSVLRSLVNGKINVRMANPYVFLNPGDTVNIDEDTFIVGLMSYAISPDFQQIDIQEA